MNRAFVTALGIIHSISGLLALLSVPVSFLGGGVSLAKVSSIVGLFLAIYFISGMGMVYETYVTVVTTDRAYTSILEKLRAYVESHPFNSPVYLYGYRSIQELKGSGESEVKLLIILLIFSVINEVPILNILPLTYYLGREYGRMRNLLMVYNQLGLGGRYVPDAIGLELATILTNGFTFGFMISRLLQLYQVLESSPLPQDQGPGQGSPLYGGGTPSP